MYMMENKCQDCNGESSFHDAERGEIVCKGCSIVLVENLIDFGQEWNEFNDEDSEKRRRTGPPATYTQVNQLVTEVGQKSDLYKLGSRKDKNKFFRLNALQHQTSVAIERNLKIALPELKRISSFLKLPRHVEEESARMYRLAVQRGLVRGRSTESVVAGTLYAACRRHEVPRTLDEISEASGVGKKEIGRTYRFTTGKLNINILPSNPADYIPRFASALSFLKAETQSRAVEILEQARSGELTSGRGPTGIAAAALYISSLIHSEKRTQREVADVAGVTEVTIRNRYKELIKKLKLEKEIEKKNKKEVSSTPTTTQKKHI